MFNLSSLNFFRQGKQNFTTNYKCHSVNMLPQSKKREEIEKGGKIILPPSTLDALTQLNIDYPMLFKLTNKRRERSTHAGVLEFIADEGNCFLPCWLMDNLLLEEGELVQIESISLPIATYSRFQPQSSDFLDISSPKAVLENALRSFACLTVSDLISIKYNNKSYDLCVLETRPHNAVSIIECDMIVEFEAPLDYKEEKMETEIKEKTAIGGTPIMVDVEDPFQGTGVRLDGKQRKAIENVDVTLAKKALPRGVPDYDYQLGSLSFDRTITPISDRMILDEPVPMEVEKNNKDEVFQGQGFSMK